MKSSPKGAAVEETGRCGCYAIQARFKGIFPGDRVPVKLVEGKEKTDAGETFDFWLMTSVVVGLLAGALALSYRGSGSTVLLLLILAGVAGMHALHLQPDQAEGRPEDSDAVSV